jgi:hypothetical protein
VLLVEAPDDRRRQLLEGRLKQLLREGPGVRPTLNSILVLEPGGAVGPGTRGEELSGAPGEQAPAGRTARSAGAAWRVIELLSFPSSARRSWLIVTTTRATRA